MDLKPGFHSMTGASGRWLVSKSSRPTNQEVWPKDRLEIGWSGGGLDFSATSSLLRKTEESPAANPSGWLQPLTSTQKSGTTEVALSRRQVSQLLTVAASLRRVAKTLSPETRRLLERTELPAVLAGVLPALTVAVDDKGFEELMKVADGLSAATGRLYKRLVPPACRPPISSGVTRIPAIRSPRS